MKRRRSDPSRVSFYTRVSFCFVFFLKKKVYICSDAMKKKSEEKCDTHENGSDLSAERRSVTDRMRD